MEQILNPYDKEFMRMAMLKHEETFKQQVYELHRLYRVQKILMNNIESSQELCNSSASKNEITIKQVSQHSSMKLHLEQPADKYIAQSNGDAVLEILDESEIELTLGPTNHTRRRMIAEAATRTSSNSRASLSSSSTGSSHLDRANIRARQVLTGTQLGLVQVPADSVKKKEVLKQQERLDRQLQQPPWLLQVLSLNVT